MLTTQQDAALQAWLDAVREDLARAGRTEQEAILDDAFRACTCEPTPAEWRSYARRYLPAYRSVPVGS